MREYKDRNIETENEAFDRYMQNVNLLEEAFSAKSSAEGTVLMNLFTKQHPLIWKTSIEVSLGKNQNLDLIWRKQIA